ncbi:MAG TPA: heme exporter protein CcmD, partial [Spongiibacteraceae bacterium]|nr:heme exporter protein CcmD [Spongiibacteraceae bacterium]
MQFDSLAAMWSMNGHGPFVWSAYAIAAVTLLALVWAPLHKQRRFFAEQRANERRRQLAQRAATSSSATNPSEWKA